MPSNGEIIAHIFSETAKGNGEPYVTALADDATFRTIGSNSWSTTFRGKDAILNDLFGRLRTKLQGRNVCVPSRIHDAGDFIIVQANGRNTTRDGKSYENDYCFVIHMRDGKMVAIEEYCDTELVTSALGPRV
jgi:ketosteroid isomerase-like protein